MKKILFILCFCIIAIEQTQANNITVSNVTLENFDEVGGSVQIQCDVSWENSWRISSGPSNWDAAWLFAKYRVDGGLWRHVTLSADNSELSDASNYNIYVSNDNKGAFVYRSETFNLNLAENSSIIEEVMLGWDFASDGIDINSTIEVRVFAIEMVYIPEGEFYVGSTGSENGRFRKGASTTSVSEPYLIDSEDEITIGTTTADLYYEDSPYGGDQLGPVPAAFPKGFNAFYCMKYELSEQQFVEFFNTVDPQYKDLIDITGYNVKNSDDEVDGNTIAWTGLGTEATTQVPDRACSFLPPSSLALYLQWAGLRPMTEFEYEKAARGPGYPVAESFAWGNTSIIDEPYSILMTSISSPTETSSSYTTSIPAYIGKGRASYDVSSANHPRPTRCGMFSSTNNLGYNLEPRIKSGASYYGVMELSGNLIEWVVGIGAPGTRSYIGSYGSTTVTNNLENPHYSPSYHWRGGGWASEVDELRIADRTVSGVSVSLIGNDIYKEIGGRGVRGADD